MNRQSARAGEPPSKVESLRKTSRLKWPGKNFARNKMRDMKITQTDLVKLLGVTSRGAVNHYFRERNPLTVSQFKALADRLRVSMDSLYSGEAQVLQSFNGIDRELLCACLAGIDSGLEQSGQKWSVKERVDLAFELHDVLKQTNTAPTAVQSLILPFLRLQSR